MKLTSPSTPTAWSISVTASSPATNAKAGSPRRNKADLHRRLSGSAQIKCLNLDNHWGMWVEQPCRPAAMLLGRSDLAAAARKFSCISEDHLAKLSRNASHTPARSHRAPANHHSNAVWAASASCGTAGVRRAALAYKTDD